jgi:hypothetical protein
MALALKYGSKFPDIPLLLESQGSEEWEGDILEIRKNRIPGALKTKQGSTITKEACHPGPEIKARA